MEQNHLFNTEVMGKLLEAKKLEKEALMLLLPEHMKGHFEIIMKELKTMLGECLMGSSFDRQRNEEDGSGHEVKSSIKKVNISYEEKEDE